LRKVGGDQTVPVTIDKGIEYLEAHLKNRPQNKNWKDTENLAKWSPPNKDPILETKDLVHIYPGDVKALDQINLKIFEGDFVAIIGQNGAGKTTLAKHFIGLLKPTNGKVLVEGQDTVNLSAGELARKVGFVLQNPDHQIFAQTVKEEVSFGPSNLGLSHDEVETRTLDALKIVGLDDRLEAFPYRLSYGDRRKLSVASILSMNPEILIYDEPTTGQDYRGRYQIVEIAKQLNDQGRTCVMITHDMNLVAKYAKRTIVLGLGRILLDGPTSEVFTQVEELAKTYIQPPQVTQLAIGLQKIGLRPDIITIEELQRTLKGQYGLEV
ncbi:unnamed protein product, partial [marine sediment metagenome]